MSRSNGRQRILVLVDSANGCAMSRTGPLAENDSGALLYPCGYVLTVDTNTASVQRMSYRR